MHLSKESHGVLSIQPLPRTVNFDALEGVLNQTGPDWLESSWYNGQRQPPLAVRLKTIINFLADEDVDRCINWEAKFAAISSYLEWLAHSDDREQLEHASLITRAMFNDAVTKAKTHVLFEKHHYEPTRVELEMPLEPLTKSTRLNWMTNMNDWRPPLRSSVPDRSGLLPRPIPPRAPTNGGEAQSEPGKPETRRAGLQQLLQALPTNLPSRVNTRWRQPIFPVPAAVLRKARERASGLHWTPPSLGRSQLPEQLEPMPYTVAYRERLERIKMMRGLARRRVEDRHARHPAWTVPRNVINSNPFVGEMVGPNIQSNRDLLRQCYTAVAMLKAAERRVPRPLLTAVLEVAERARGIHRVPEGVELADDEWEEARGGWGQALPMLLDLDEVKWLKFLAGECVNGRNWTGRFVPDTPKDKYRLFLIFAARVQKLLDDKNPEGLFSQHDAEVTVEELLEAVNAGTDSSAVTKREFHPYEACAWLDRMNESGHVR